MFFSFYRIQQNRSTENSSSCRGIRLANITEGTSGISSKKPSPSPFRASPFELSRGLGKKSSLLDSDSDSDDETDHIGALSGEGDSDMELDEPDQRSVSMATGITHDHPYAWALDGRVASLNEGNSMPGHIHVRLKEKHYRKFSAVSGILFQFKSNSAACRLQQFSYFGLAVLDQRCRRKDMSLLYQLVSCNNRLGSNDFTPSHSNKP